MSTEKTHSAKCEMHAKSYGRGDVIQFMCTTNILMILKESWKLRLTTSAQTISSEKVWNKFQDKLMRGLVTSNSYAKSQMESNNEFKQFKILIKTFLFQK